MDRMQALPLADQDRWLLLHGSLQRRVAHLNRPVPPGLPVYLQVLYIYKIIGQSFRTGMTVPTDEPQV
jgi:hypothetical protein